MATDRKYEISLTGLGEGVNDFDFKVDGSLFAGDEGGEVTGADVDVHAEIEKRHGNYLCRLDFDGWVETPCNRCLDPVRIEIGTEYDFTVKHGEEYDDTDEELLILPWDATRLDLGPVIHDTLLLEIPLRCVHEEGSCNPDMDAALEKHGGKNTETE